MGVITIAVADSHLDVDIFVEWDGLDEPFKQQYIDQASAYARLKWQPPESDTDFDWTDSTTWDDKASLEALIAQYADEARAGNLYPNRSANNTPNTPLKKTTKKLGSLEETIEYAQADSVNRSYSLNQLHDQMRVLGFSEIYKAQRLVRV